MFFSILYRLYLTSVGRWFHNKVLAKVRRDHVHPHCEFRKNTGSPQFIIEGDLQVIPVPFSYDNLAYILLWKPTGQYCLVDPADFEAVHEVLEEYDIKGAPESILTTHMHHDHAAHNQQFLNEYPDVKIVCGENEPVYAANTRLQDGETMDLLSGNVSVKAIESACHTAGHTMFEIKLANSDQKIIFTGDNLFEGGVGKFLEGTPLMMHSILYRMLEYEEDAENIKLFFGHDYGWKNIMWVRESIFSKEKICPDTSPRILQLRDKIEAKYERLMELRNPEKTYCSTGTTLKDELELNLFLNIVKEASSHGYEDGENELGLDELGDFIGCQ